MFRNEKNRPIYHWDLPQYVYDDTNQGWIDMNSTKIQDYYVKYADTLFKYFGSRIKNWITFNEPWTFCVEGYGTGQHAPGNTLKNAKLEICLIFRSHCNCNRAIFMCT